MTLKGRDREEGGGGDTGGECWRWEGGGGGGSGMSMCRIRD